MIIQLLRSCLCTSKYRIQEPKRFYKWAAAASRKQANRSRGIPAKKAKGSQPVMLPSPPTANCGKSRWSKPKCNVRDDLAAKRASVPNQATTLTPVTPRILVLQLSFLFILTVGRAKVLALPLFPSLPEIQQQSIMWFKLGYLFKTLYFLKFPFRLR